VAERELGAALGHARAVRAVLLAVLGPARDQHVAQASVPGCCAGAAACSAGAAAGAEGCSALAPRREALRSLRRPRGRSARRSEERRVGKERGAEWATEP